MLLLGGPDPTAPPLVGGASPAGSPPVTGFLALLEQTFAETTAVPDALEHLDRLNCSTPILTLPRQEVDTVVRAIVAALPSQSVVREIVSLAT